MQKCLRNAAFWLNSVAAVWGLAGVASLWLLSVNCSSPVSLHQINTLLTQSSPSLFLSLSLSLSTLTVRLVALPCAWRRVGHHESDSCPVCLSVCLLSLWLGECVCVSYVLRVFVRLCECVSFSRGLRFLRWGVRSLLTRCASDVAHHMLTCILCLQWEICSNVSDWTPTAQAVSVCIVLVFVIAPCFFLMTFLTQLKGKDSTVDRNIT